MRTYGGLEVDIADRFVTGAGWHIVTAIATRNGHVPNQGRVTSLFGKGKKVNSQSSIQLL